MSLTAIKAQLITELQTVQGFNDARDKPLLAPASDCPLLILDYDPARFLGVQPLNVGEVWYSWYFTIKGLLKPIGQGIQNEWWLELEPLPARVVAALSSSLTVGGTAVDLELAQRFKLGVIQYAQQQWFGFEIPVRVNEKAATVIAP